MRLRCTHTRIRSVCGCLCAGGSAVDHTPPHTYTGNDYVIGLGTIFQFARSFGSAHAAAALVERPRVYLCGSFAVAVWQPAKWRVGHT